jgi:hypothetical protein
VKWTNWERRWFSDWSDGDIAYTFGFSSFLPCIHVLRNDDGEAHFVMLAWFNVGWCWSRYLRGVVS